MPGPGQIRTAVPVSAFPGCRPPPVGGLHASGPSSGQLLRALQLSVLPASLSPAPKHQQWMRHVLCGWSMRSKAAASNAAFWSARVFATCNLAPGLDEASSNEGAWLSWLLSTGGPSISNAALAQGHDEIHQLAIASLIGANIYRACVLPALVLGWNEITSGAGFECIEAGLHHHGNTYSLTSR